MVKVVKFIFHVISEWFAQSSVAKGTATVAMGSSIGFITMMGFVKEQIVEVRADTAVKIEQSEQRLNARVTYLEEILKIQMNEIKEDNKYMRGAIDTTNQNVLRALSEKRK